MSKYLVGIDDGHGMETAGKRTPALKEDLKFRGKTYRKGSIIHENDFNENLMELLEKELDRCGIGHIQLAPGDTDISLQNRVKKANSNKCDLVVSLHANALTGSWQEKAYGLVVIHHKNCQAKSKTLANNCYNYLYKDVKWHSNGATKYGVKADTDISGYALYILKYTSMPAVLIEYGFMDNWEDVKVMVTDEFQKACAKATAKGICETLGVKYVEEYKTSSANTTDTSNTWENGTYNVKVRATANLNLRSGRGTNYSIIHTIPKGTVFELGYVYNNWGSTWDFKDKVGYLCCDYIEKV